MNSSQEGGYGDSRKFGMRAWEENGGLMGCAARDGERCGEASFQKEAVGSKHSSGVRTRGDRTCPRSSLTLSLRERGGQDAGKLYLVPSDSPPMNSKIPLHLELRK